MGVILEIDESFCLSFPVVKGHQANKEYYITQCTFDVLCQITSFDSQGVPPDMRAQRVLNKRRVTDIQKYIHDNPYTYVFSAITVSIDEVASFQPVMKDGYSGNVGILKVPATTKFIINDGQHRCAAISRAIEDDDSLRHESIPLVIFIDSELKQSQQMFADLNRYAVRPSKSLSILYDNRDPLSKATFEIIGATPIFRGAIELEKTSLSRRSTNLFTLSNVYQAMGKLLQKGPGDQISSAEKTTALEYWTSLAVIIPEWRQFSKREMKSSVMRTDCVHSHGVVLVALGMAGHDLLAAHPSEWRHYLSNLRSVDWRRSATQLWEGVAMEKGKISKAHRNVKLTAIKLKEFMGLELDENEVAYRETTSRKVNRE